MYTRFGPGRDIKHPKRTGLIAYPHLPHGTPYAWHRLPVIRVQSALNAIELVPRLAPGRVRKSSEIVEGRPQE